MHQPRGGAEPSSQGGEGGDGCRRQGTGRRGHGRKGEEGEKVAEGQGIKRAEGEEEIEEDEQTSELCVQLGVLRHEVAEMDQRLCVISQQLGEDAAMRLSVPMSVVHRGLSALEVVRY